MLDTHAVARSLTAADFTPAQADALTDAMREFTERGDHVTPDQFKAGQAEVKSEIAELRSEQRTQIAEVRTEIANLDTRLSTQITELRAEQQTGIAGAGTELADGRLAIARRAAAQPFPPLTRRGTAGFRPSAPPSQV
ncbi:MAG: hypothetical protein OXG35_12645, partial [Acidobacteria bacterium]|nr:hypothetical protein [Acidobacteriota bacterium]